MDPASTSDERGVFRIYGLMPGTYAVAAIPSAGRSPLTASTSAEIDARLARLGQPRNQLGPANPVGTPPPPPRAVAFAPTFFPGTTLYTEAGLVRVQAGEERDGVDFELSHVPVARIEGLISGDIPDLSAVELTIINPGLTLPLGFGAFAITTTPPSTLGQFSYANVPPGRYRIVARARREDAAVPKPPAPAGAARGGGGGGGSTVTVWPGGVASSFVGEQLFAFADVDVRGADVRGVALALRPGGSIAGQVAFDATTAPKPENLSGVQVALSVIGGTYSASGSGTVSGNALMGLSPVTADVNGNFRITGIGPTSYSLSVLLPEALRKTWAIRSAMIGGRDLLDETIDGPFVDLSGVTVTLSDTRTELSGTLQLAGGQPAAEYFVIVFSADRRHWQTESRRSKSTRPATDGRFVFADLPAGEYLLAALADLEPAGWQEAPFLERVAPAAIRITLGHGEKKVQDLRVR
jgi:hypothetical protein